MDEPRTVIGARLLRAIFAVGFLTVAAVVTDQPTEGWFHPEVWPWITGVTGVVLAWSVASMSERADTWSAATITVTSVAWIAAIVDIALGAVAAGRSIDTHIIVVALWMLIAATGAAWPWIMRPSRIQHRANVASPRRVPHDTG